MFDSCAEAFGEEIVTRIYRDGHVEDAPKSLATRGPRVQLTLGLAEPEAPPSDPMEGVRTGGKKKRKRSSKERSERKSKDPTRLAYYAPSEVVKTMNGQHLLVCGHLAGWIMVRVKRGDKVGQLLTIEDRRVEFVERYYGRPSLVKGW